MTYVLGAGSITSLLTTLPAGGNTLGGRLSAQVGRAAGSCANCVTIAAEDDVAIHAVIGVGLCAVDRDIVAGDLLRSGGGKGGAREDES